MNRRLHTREDSGLTIDREGRWLHDGEPVTHPRVLEAFTRGLELTPEGHYLLRFGNDWAFVTVEDAPLQVTSALPAPSADEVLLNLSNGLTEPLRPETLCHSEGVLYCTAASGMPARFSRSAQAALASMLEEDASGLVLVLGPARHPIAERA